MSVISASEIGVVLQGVGALAQAAAIFVAAWLASNTFHSWRRQKLSERRIEQAERILTAVYKVRRALSHVRNPAMFKYETELAKDDLKSRDQWPTSSEDQRKATTQQAYYNRIQATQSDRKALEECQPMARALFGEDLELALETMGHQFYIFGSYVDANARDIG